MRFIIVVCIFMLPSVLYGQFRSGESPRHELTINSSVLANSISGDNKSIVGAGLGLEYGFFLKQLTIRTNPTYYLSDSSFPSIPVHIGYRLFNNDLVYDTGIDLEIDVGPNFSFFNYNNFTDDLVVVRKRGLFGDLEARMSFDFNSVFCSLILGYSYLFTDNFKIYDSFNKMYTDEKVGKHFFKIGFNVGWRFMDRK